jgi:hypothetical protein
VRREELVRRTRQLIDEGERLRAAPGLGALQLWLQLSDDLLRAAWGSMDRFHLAWLSVGRPRTIVRGRPMSPVEEAGYVVEVAAAKNAVLRASLDAAERGLPFVGETGGVGAGRAQPSRAGGPDQRGTGAGAPGGAGAGAGAPEETHIARDERRTPPSLPEVTRDVAEARRRAVLHQEHRGPRAPRPEKMQR